jgi:hypothetical protein
MVSRSLSLLAVGSFLAIAPAFAQTNESTPPSAPAQRRQIPAPTNLKVLPKDITGQQVITIMRGFTGDLGVECTYCHARNSETGRPDFPSDANPMKDRARVMIKMAGAINTEYLTQLTDPKPANPVTCGTCHRGMSKPEVFVPAPREHRGPSTPVAPTTPQSSK